MENVIVGAAEPLFNANPTAQIRIICEEELLTYTPGQLLSAGLTLALRYVTVAYYTQTAITASLCATATVQLGDRIRKERGKADGSVCQL